MPKNKLKTKRKIEPFAFGTSTKRFARLGLHPELDPSGSLKKVDRHLSPGQYNVKFVECPSRLKQESTWTRMAELEEFSKFLGFRNAPILEAREFQKVHRGPGTYNIPDDVDKKKSWSVKDNQGFTTEKRFVDVEDQGGPPPNTYFRKMNARPYNSKKSFGNVHEFEWDNLVPRFKDTEPKFHLPPNLYQVPDPTSIEALMKKVVSLKGPYNLFTGARDGTSIKNYFSPPNIVVPERYNEELSDLDYMLRHPTKSRYGKFMQEKRFPKKPTARMLISDMTRCYRDPNEPGPGRYDISRDSAFKTVKESIHPFNFSHTYARPQTRWTIHPGPGRYYIKQPKCSQKPQQSYVFKSKTERKFFPKQDVYTDFE